MAEFKVGWTIDVEADNAEEAALEAFEMMQVPTTATIFNVTDKKGCKFYVDIYDLLFA